jgi:hypothetical protein
VAVCDTVTAHRLFCLFVRSFVRLFVFYLFVRSFIHSFILSFVCLFVCLCVCVCLFVCLHSVTKVISSLGTDFKPVLPSNQYIVVQKLHF